MSHVTNIILLTEIDDPGVSDVQEYLTKKYNSTLLNAKESAGGSKVVEGDIWVGAFNKLDIPGLIRMVFESNFEDQESVQLLVKDEHEIKYTVYLPPPKDSLEW